MKRRFDFFWRDSLNQCTASQRRTAVGVLGAAFFASFGVGAFTFVLSVNAESAGLSASWLGLAFSGYFLARLVLAPLAGYGADRIGAMPMLLWATGIGAVIPALYVVFPANETFGVIQIGLGFCGGILKPVSMSLLGECVPKDVRGRLYGAYNTCLYAALVLAPLAGGAAGAINDGMGTFALALPGLGMGATFLLFLRAGSGAAAAGRQKRGKSDGPTWREPAFVALLLAVFGRTLGSSVVITFLPRLINERYGLNGFGAGALFAIPSIVIILGMPATSRWADLRDRTGLTFLGMGLCAACLFGYGQPLPLTAFAGLAVIMGLGSALSLPASMSLASDMGPAKGSVMGTFLGAANLGFVAGPVLAGFAAEYGNMADAFEFTALVSGLCLFPTFLLMAGKRQLR